MKTMENSQSMNTGLRNLLMAMCFTALVTLPVAAQSIFTTQENLQVEIINTTTGGPGTIDRLVLQYSSTRLEPVLDIRPTGSTFEIPDVPIQDIGKYVLTVWCQDVPYYWELRGKKLLAKPLQLHVFATAQDLTDVSIVGLDLLLRKTESLLELDYMLQVENSAQPQVTMLGEPQVMVALPDNARSATLTYGNGPEPEELKLSHLSGGKAKLAIPLTTGKNQIRLRTTVEWIDGMEIPISANVPIESWGLMATPVSLDIQAFDLEPIDAAGRGGNLQYRGPQVAADEVFVFRIATSQGAGEVEDLFTRKSTTESDSETPTPGKDEEGGRGFPFVVLTPILVVIIAAVARKRRRS